jgi:hypothetical protein
VLVADVEEELGLLGRLDERAGRAHVAVLGEGGVCGRMTNESGQQGVPHRGDGSRTCCPSTSSGLEVRQGAR